MKTKEQVESEIKPLMHDSSAVTDYVISTCEKAVEEELKVEHILSGIDELAKGWFAEVGTKQSRFPIEEMYKRIESNFDPSRALGSLSKQNWRFDKRTKLAGHNKSKEKVLEKKIAEYTDDNWANQVPAASGYRGAGGRKRSIDLVFKSPNSAHVIFYELKVLPESGNAFDAAIELLGYGLLYLYSRSRLQEYSDSPYMKAETVELRVLGTQDYYQRQNRKATGPTKSLQETLSNQLGTFALQNVSNLRMDFGFATFAEDFVWDVEKDRNDEAKIKNAVAGIRPLFI